MGGNSARGAGQIGSGITEHCPMLLSGFFVRIIIIDIVKDKVLLTIIIQPDSARRQIDGVRARIICA